MVQGQRGSVWWWLLRHGVWPAGSWELSRGKGPSLGEETLLAGWRCLPWGSKGPEVGRAALGTQRGLGQEGP